MPKTVRKRRTRLSRRLSQFRALRVLNKDRSFALVLVVVLGIAGLILGGTLRTLSSTPATYSGPALRVSGLDWVQAWSLKRSAQREAAQGRHEEALYTWRAAVARNLGDPSLHRGILEHLLRMPKPAPVNRILAETSSRWLSRLNGPHTADLPLQALALERYGAPKAGLALLQHAAGPGGGTTGSDAFRRALACCLLSSGDVGGFGALWQTHGTSWASDPLLPWYGHAWMACSDPGTRGQESLDQLRSASRGDGLDAVISARLLLLAGERRLNSADMAAALSELKRLKADTTGEHLRYWRQLGAAGQTAQAREAASSYQGTPLDAAEAALYVESLLALDLGSHALGFLDATIQGYGPDVGLWQAYLEALIRMERWSEFRRACATARLLSSRQESIQGEVAHAELRAGLATGRTGDVERAAPEVARSTFASADRLLAAADSLCQARFPDHAAHLLTRFQTEFSGNPDYWLAWFRVGMLRHDLEAVRRAVGELTRLRPGDPAVDLARAGLLLVTGENEAEALQLTLHAFQKNPDHPAVRINHAFALVHHQRAAEAARLLEGIRTNRLSSDLRTQFALARAEAAAALGQLEDARAAAAQVPESDLFPIQRERLARVLHPVNASR